MSSSTPDAFQGHSVLQPQSEQEPKVTDHVGEERTAQGHTEPHALGLSWPTIEKSSLNCIHLCMKLMSVNMIIIFIQEE